MWSELWSNLWSSIFFSILRPMLKWILRRVTGKCELLRITYEENHGSQRTKRIEKSLKLSHQPFVKQLIVPENVDVEVAEATKEIMKIKDIVPEVHSRFSSSFSCCLSQVVGYKKLKNEVELMRTTPYSSDNIHHENKLLQLWNLLMPDTKLESRISRQWTDIGFQGEDPKTDFRGMGMLGFNQLLYFSENYTKEARNVLSQSHHPQYGYSYAIVGINLTSMIYTLLKGGKLRTHFYNLKQAPVTIQDLHDVYCYLFQEFNKFWFREKPKDIMEFGRLRDKFNKQIAERLQEPRTILQYNNKD
ncbi:ELMO domain-containing protein 2 [Patella vulgata]|uniref:ELMO domain-containing protein 2 n=1 Tax=Patella vulgata TaxID=6465 RepID=UPI002180782D|nr:ELMO domain-containing protein 2 [Patella vulgata]XP_050417715.1 ELMO domain-containing protein 2 [Patella vulgata]XP_050417716.1 ELMO domain-containing protein 2 [Patella vulgata]